MFANENTQKWRFMLWLFAYMYAQTWRRVIWLIVYICSNMMMHEMINCIYTYAQMWNACNTVETVQDVCYTDNTVIAKIRSQLQLYIIWSKDHFEVAPEQDARAG